MSRKTHRPTWPLYRWPHAGESTVHAACREWDLPCGCEMCRAAGLPELPKEEEAQRDA